MFDRLATHRPRTIRNLSPRTRRITIGTAAVIPALLIGVLGSPHPDTPQDSGLVACAYPLATQDVPAAEYPKLRAEWEEHPRLGYEIINLGRGEPVLVSDFLGELEARAGKKALTLNEPMPKADFEATFADISKAAGLLGYAPRVSVREGVRLSHEWFSRTFG